VVPCRRATPVSHPTSTYSCCRSCCCPSASPSQVAQRHAAPTPHIRHVAPWRLGYKHVSSTNFSTFDFSFQDMEATAEGAQSSLQSATQRGRHRCQGHLQRPVDRLHQSNLIVRLKAAQLLGGLADIAVVDVSQEASIIERGRKILSTHSLLHIYNQHQSSRNCVVSRKTCFIS
jgi:hypothetical protein